MNGIKIPIISQDLAQDEVCIRAIQTFEHLDKAIDAVFSKIDERISSLIKRTSEYNERIQIASTTIEALKGSKKALRMYSPAKYPVKQEHRFYPTFDKDLDFHLDFNYTIKNNATDGFEQRKYSDKLQFYHLKRARVQAAPKPSLVMTTKSINSLITFVNNENIILNESAPKARAKISVVNEIVQSDSTDFSRFSSMIKSKHDAENFHYFPNMNQAPDIELPIDLPDLPGIADDIAYTAVNQELIVPSMAKMNIINELPNIDDLIEAESNKKLNELKVQDLKTSKAVEQETSSSSPPKPPAMSINIPPPPPPIPTSFAAPPPPPPPVPQIVKPQGNQSEQKQKASTEPPDVRSSLMQAIRSAGGKSKLRSIPAADEQPEQARKKPQAAPAGDLMSDLHAKLAMRRRGIAGTKEAKKEKSSLMDKVSKMIPPPTSDSDSSTSGGDWE